MTDRERIARALQSALGEDLSAVLDRVTKVVEEVRAEEREACEIAESIRARGAR